MKTVQDYLNDPRILNDPDMKDAMEPIKEIHAICLKIQDEMELMGEAEYYEKINTALEKKGISLCLNRAGIGRM